MSAHKREQASKRSRQGRRSLSEAQSLSSTTLYERKCRLTGRPSSSGSPAPRRKAQESLPNITEQLDSPSILRSDGFLQTVLQRILQSDFDMIGKRAAVHLVDFRTACRLCHIVELMLGYIKRPTCMLPESIYMERYLPDGSFRIADETAKTLRMKCIQASKQCQRDVFSVETLVGFADVLRRVLQPVVEAYFSGTLQLVPPPLMSDGLATVATLEREERARLSTAFFNTLILAMKDEVTTGSLRDLLSTIDPVLRSRGLALSVKREELRDENERFDRAKLLWGFEKYVLDFEAGFMKISLLLLIVVCLNASLSSYRK